MQERVTADNFEMVGTAVVSIVSGLDEEDEQSEDNLDIIANVYENITELVESGDIMITENVNILILKDEQCFKQFMLTVCREYCRCCERYIYLARRSCEHSVISVSQSSHCHEL